MLTECGCIAGRIGVRLNLRYHPAAPRVFEFPLRKTKLPRQKAVSPAARVAEVACDVTRMVHSDRLGVSCTCNINSCDRAIGAAQEAVRSRSVRPNSHDIPGGIDGPTRRGSRAGNGDLDYSAVRLAQEPLSLPARVGVAAHDPMGVRDGHCGCRC